MITLSSKTKVMLAFLLTILLAVLGLLNLHERVNKMPLPDDGVAWVDAKDGVKADTVRISSPADKAGIAKGDILRAVAVDSNRPLQIDQARDIFLLLDEQIGIGKSVTYIIERRSLNGQTNLWYADISRIEPEPSNLPLEIYLAIVGVVFIIVGLYVLRKQPDSPYAFHFYLICLLVSTTYCLKSAGSFSNIDKLVYCLDAWSFIALAPLFLHFCLLFPFRREFINRHNWLLKVIYLPALVLGLFPFMVLMLGTLLGANESLATSSRWIANFYEQLLMWNPLVEKAKVSHFSLAFLISSGLMLITFMQTRASILRQQLKWIVWGLSLNSLPFTIFYVYPYLSGHGVSNMQAALATGASILLPISFGYSIVRYRLMDVDIIVRRSMTYAIATILLVVIFMLGIVKAGEWVKELVPSASQNLTLFMQVAVMSMAAMLFSPIKNWLEERIDRLFFGERYDYRRGLADFGRTLSSTTSMNDLLSSLANRLSEMLTVQRLAIFIESEETASHFCLAYSRDLLIEPEISPEIMGLIYDAKYRRGYVVADQLDRLEADVNRRTIHYYVPCYVHDRLVAIIGLGKTIEGALLTSEDIELVKNLSGYVAVAIENSLLYRSEQEKADALTRLKDFSENIIESINIGLLAIDREGHITNWNSALETLLTLNRSDVIGKLIRDVFDEDLIHTICTATGSVGWQVSQVYNIYRYKTIAKDGRELVINISLSPLEATDDSLAGTLILIEDITARVRLEAQMRETDKLSSIGLLAAGVAHEVNTPLTGISSYTQMLLAQTNLSDSKHAILEKIKRQTTRASEIVNNLLNFSRTSNVELTEVDIHKVLDDTIQLLEPQLRNTQIKIEKQFEEHLPHTVGSFSKLQQVFMNLLLNARDAMPNGGILTIKTQLQEGMLLVNIIDTGVGIAPENIAKIYDPFFTTKGVGQGTGLGLAVSYGIIQEHKGRIFVESKTGLGTCFHIKLPPVMLQMQAIAGD